ncbi:MAG: hypothetical protein ACI4M5_00135 [Christensenellales bacterium]
MRYTLQINCDKLKIVKIILLAVCLVVDFGNLWIFLTGIVSKNIREIIKSLAIFAILICVRVIACALTYKWRYDFDNEKVEVYKLILGKKLHNTTIEYAKIERMEKVGSEALKATSKSGAIVLAPTHCNYEKYAITIDNKLYIIALDEYGYCKLKGKTNDLS